jgi:gas vesicle protein
MIMDKDEFARVFYFLAGAFVGAGVALLVAPQSGAKLRRMLQRYAYEAGGELIEKGREAWDTAVEQGKEYLETGIEAIRGATKTGR